jgi:hypothetical protein
MPITLNASNNLSAARASDALRSDTATVNHSVEAGAVLQTGSDGNSEVTAELTGSSGNTAINCADPADVLARLRGGHLVTRASDTKAFTVRADAQLDVAVTARVHAEVFARVDGGELQNAGATDITTPCDDPPAVDGQDGGFHPTANPARQRDAVSQGG